MISKISTDVSETKISYKDDVLNVIKEKSLNIDNLLQPCYNSNSTFKDLSKLLKYKNNFKNRYTRRIQKRILRRIKHCENENIDLKYTFKHFSSDKNDLQTSTPVKCINSGDNAELEISYNMNTSFSNLIQQKETLAHNTDLGVSVNQENIIKYQDPSSENIDISESIISMDPKVQKTIPLPEGSYNHKTKNWIISKYSMCKHYEGSFNITCNELKKYHFWLLYIPHYKENKVS